MGIFIGILFILVTMVVPCYYLFKAVVAERRENIKYSKLERERANKANCRH